MFSLIANWLVDYSVAIVISSQHRPKPQLDTLTFGSENVFSTNAARNIGVTMDDKINFEKQVAFICKSASFYHIRNIALIRRFLSEESRKALVHALVICGFRITVTRFSTACRRIRLKSFNVFRTVLLV